MQIINTRDLIIKATAELALQLAQAVLWNVVRPGTIQESEIAEARNRLRELVEDFDPEGRNV